MILFFGGCTFIYKPSSDLYKPSTTPPLENETCSEPKPSKPAPQEIWVESKTSRIWVSPHVDTNGDYIDGYYKYIILKPGHWAINGNQTPPSQ